MEHVGAIIDMFYKGYMDISQGLHLFILFLNSFSDLASFISLGTMDHILGPKTDKVSVPYETVRTCLD